MNKHKIALDLALCALILLIVISCARAADEQMSITSQSLMSLSPIPDDFTCTGADKSPPLRWHGAPKSTKGFALIVSDPDAPGGTFVHWVAYNIPATATSLPAGLARSAEISGGGINGVNDFGHLGYNGPCPPPGKVHHYHFKLFAVESILSVGHGADAAAVNSALKGHVVGSAELIGTYSR